MEYEYLYPVLEQLCEKYVRFPFAKWVELDDSGEDSLHDYSEDLDEPAFFWQAHTRLLEFRENEDGRFAHIAIFIYPEGVHSSPPAPAAEALIYESGVCDVGLPWKEYIFDQITGSRTEMP